MDTPEPPIFPDNGDAMLTSPRPLDPVLFPPPRTLSYWVKKLLVCNPFYLVSAGLLLYGLYLISSDANFPGKELAQFGVNFGALQLYEMLLVATAIFLARRRIWYDSNLLIFLEAGLILAPFILISQAALISSNILRGTCLVAGATAVLRFGSLKQLHASLNLPRALLLVGVIVLVVNIALPMIYRPLHEAKLGIKPAYGPAYYVNEYSWLLMLPLLVALANFLPRPAKVGDQLPERRWIPTGVFALWTAGTVVHLYCLGYVYNFDWEQRFMLPPLWMLAWTLYNRVPDFCRARSLRHALTVLPAVVTLMTPGATPEIFLSLTGLNILAYAILHWRNRPNPLALHLMIVSIGALVVGFIGRFEPRLPDYINTVSCALVLIVAYICYWIVLSRNPKLGILGAIIVGAVCGGLFERWFEGPHFSIQIGLVFLLLHSLLWKDDAHLGAAGARLFGCILWAMHSLAVVLTAWPHSIETLTAGATLVIAVSVTLKLTRARWPAPVVPITAGIVLLMHPGNRGVVEAQSVPAGLWVMAGSFALFVVGTILALTRTRWHPAGAAATTEHKSD